MHTTQTHIQHAAANIATAARINIQLAADINGTTMSPTDALELAATNAIANATDATKRTGIWSYESTTEQIETAQFQGAVARDILDGTIERPSTGNVRAYALALI